jgi:peroxiredoxin
MSRNKLSEQVKAPDFELVDTNGRMVRLSAYTSQSPIVLVLTRGFV